MYKMSTLKILTNSVQYYFFNSFPENHILYAVYPFLKLFKCFGFYPINMSVKDDNVYFQFDLASSLLSVLGLLLYIGGFIMGAKNLHEESKLKAIEFSTISFICAWAQIFAFFMLGLVCVLTSWTKLKLQNELFKKLQQIDDSMAMLNIRFSYKSFKRSLLLQISALAIVPLCCSMVNCIVLNKTFTTPFSSCFWFICFFPISLVTIKEYQFYNTMMLLHDKLRAINRKLEELSLSKYRSSDDAEQCRFVVSHTNGYDCCACHLMPEDNIFLDNEIMKILRKLSNVYTDVNDAARMVMNIFDWHLLFTTIVCFCVLTIQTYNVYATFVGHTMKYNSTKIIGVFSWILTQGAVVCVNVSVCARVLEVMTETGIILHAVEANVENSQLFQVVQIFSLKILHRHTSFTAAGFFNLDYKLVTSIIAAVTTYLIIIIQCDLSDISVNRNFTLAN